MQALANVAPAPCADGGGRRRGHALLRAAALHGAPFGAAPGCTGRRERVVGAGAGHRVGRHRGRSQLSGGHPCACPWHRVACRQVERDRPRSTARPDAARPRGCFSFSISGGPAVAGLERLCLAQGEQRASCAGHAGPPYRSRRDAPTDEKGRSTHGRRCGRPPWVAGDGQLHPDAAG